MFESLSKWGDKLLTVIGALVLLQFPFFYQQYLQHLSGRVAELHKQVELMKENAQLSGKTLRRYIDKFIDHHDSDIALQGHAMQHLTRRHEHLQVVFERLNGASTVMRPFYFVRLATWQEVADTARVFQPGLLINAEGLIYGLFGMLLGTVSYRFLCFCLYLSSLFAKRVFNP